MKKTLFSLLAILAIAISFTSCKKDPVRAESDHLVGEWGNLAIGSSYIFAADGTYTYITNATRQYLKKQEKGTYTKTADTWTVVPTINGTKTRTYTYIFSDDDFTMTIKGGDLTVPYNVLRFGPEYNPVPDEYLD